MMKINLESLVRKVGDTEIKLQEFIRNELKEIYGEDWWSKGVKGVIEQKNAQRIFEKDIKNAPWLKDTNGFSPDNIRYLLIPDLQKIITCEKNWGYFKKYFPDKKRTESVFSFYYDFARNLISHTKPEQMYDITIIKLGTASMDYIRRCIGIKEAQAEIWAGTKDFPEINELWSKIDSIRDWETANKLNSKFEEKMISTDDQDLKLICKHGIALTSKYFSESFQKLSEIFYEDKEYEGYKNHNFYQDSFKEFWFSRHREPPLFLVEIYNQLCQNNQIGGILECFYLYAEPEAESKFTLEIGRKLLELHPKNLKLIEKFMNVVEYFNHKEAFQYWKQLIFEGEHPGDYSDYVNLFEDFNSLDEFLEILNKLKEKGCISHLDYYKFSAYHYHDRLIESIKKSESHDKLRELYKKTEECYLKAFGADSKDTVLVIHLLQWYSIQKNWEEVKKYGEALLKIPNLNVYWFMDYVHIVEKKIKLQKSKEKDYSELIVLLNRGLKLFPDEKMLHGELGDIYYQIPLIEKAIEHYEKVLENPGEEDRWFSIIEDSESLAIFDDDMRYFPFTRNKSSINETASKTSEKDESIVPKKLSEVEISALDRLIDIYLQRGNIPKAYELCKKIEKAPIEDYKKYCSSVYLLYAEYLQKNNIE